MNNNNHSKRLPTALSSFPWLPDLQQKRTHAEAEEPVTDDETEDEIDPLTFEQFERQCYDELMRIHRDAFTRPMPEHDYERSKFIVSEWRQRKQSQG